MNVDYKKLDVLRQSTVLGPIDKAKVLLARRNAEKFREYYIKQNPSDIIEVDYSVADELELNLRFLVLERYLERSWKNYSNMENDGYSLIEYTEDYIKQQVEKEQSTSL